MSYDSGLVKMIYSENGLIFREMLEWRHKIMLRYFVSIGVLGFALKWLYETQETRPYIWVIFFLASLISVLCAYLDTANHTALKDCLEVGKKIECKVPVDGEIIGYFSESGGKNYLENGVRFTTVFRWFYGLAAMGWILLAGYSAWKWWV